MSQPAPGRLRRAAFVVFTTLGVFLGLAGAFLLIAFWAVPKWQSDLEPILGKPDDSLIWQVTAGILIAEGAMILLAWLFSFDTRAPRRPWVGMTLVLASGGILLGAAAVGAPVILGDIGALSPAGGAIIAGGGILLPAIWYAIESAIRSILGAWVKSADRGNRPRLALFLSRVRLLFSPGSRETLCSIALERFRRGDRSEQVRHDLQTFFEDGDSSEALAESLCRLAAEQRDTAKYLFFLTRLHTLRPDDDDLAEALIAENMAQGNQIQALRLIEKKGVGDSIADRERYARALLATDDIDKAVGIAREISEEEGIPYSVSGELLRKILEVRPTLFSAMNLLGEQATASRNLDRAVHRFEESLKVEPNQPRVKRQLLALYRETHLTEAMETLLAEIVGAPESATDLELAKEYSDVLIMNKKATEARAFLEKLHLRHPKDFGVTDRFADVLCTAEEWKEAAEINAQALEQAGREDAKSRARSRAARIERALLTAEVYDLQQEVESKPKDVELALQLVRRLGESGQQERAVNQADSLLHRVPDARPRVKELVRDLGLRPDGPFIFLSFLVDLHLADNEFDSAIQLIDSLRVRSLTPEAVESDLCQRILQRVPNHLEALRRMGEVSQREHRFADMVHYFVLYTVHGGESTDEISKFLFEAYENLNDYKNAKSYGEKMVEAHPESDTFALRLAQLAFKATQYDEALHFARVARDRNGENLETRRLVNKIDRIRRESVAAELQAKLDGGKADGQDLEDLADLYLSLDQLDKTIPLYQRAARDPERETRAKAKLAVCLAQKGLHDLADETLAGIQIPNDSEETPLFLDLLYQVASQFEAERMIERAGRLYKKIFLVDAGYRDVVKKIEKFTS